MTWADVNCNCKGGHQQAAGEVLAPPGLQAKGQDEEWEVMVSMKNQKRTGRTDTSTGSDDYTSAAILIENVQDY